MEKTYLQRVCKHHGLTDYYVRKNGQVDCKKCTYENVRRNQNNIKKTLVKESGGMCIICGYNKYEGALDFHHLVPSEKIMALNKANAVSIDRMREEAKKCILVCANCHREIEAGLVDVSLLTNESRYGKIENS